MISKSFLIDKFSIRRYVASQNIIQQYESNIEFPRLVSFPRTGSHWLRMMLELYTNRPLLIRSFYNHNNRNYLLLHTHDLQLKEKPQNVIYLYRNPLDVVFSQINYYQQDWTNKNFVINWSSQYASHLAHWLFLENFTSTKAILTYEELMNNSEKGFKKICEYFDLVFDNVKFLTALKKVNKNEVKEKTNHDKQVLNNDPLYEVNRLNFKDKNKYLIYEVFSQISFWLFKDSTKLPDVFQW